ncbi:MAG TPA: hypothetical protein VM282_16945 [Acidimicrobiales bacterium]|nr:hypothetical protein [Acidimicrobiales bacterium]
MSKKLDKHEAERLIAALDDLCADADRLPRLRAAAAPALARLLGRDAPWRELVESAAAVAGWSRDRVRRLTDDSPANADDALDAMYELITELSETRRL